MKPWPLKGRGKTIKPVPENDLVEALLNKHVKAVTLKIFQELKGNMEKDERTNYKQVELTTKSLKDRKKRKLCSHKVQKLK